MINKTKNRKASDLRMFETSSRGRIRQVSIGGVQETIQRLVTEPR